MKRAACQHESHTPVSLAASFTDVARGAPRARAPCPPSAVEAVVWMYARAVRVEYIQTTASTALGVRGGLARDARRPTTLGSSDLERSRAISSDLERSRAISSEPRAER